MRREVVDPTIGERDEETHPAFGMIAAHRVTYGGGGQVLFDSEVQHAQTVTITISHASRKRDLNHDWLFPHKQVIEIEMSEAQWASFVSAMNTQGVACTLRQVGDDFDVPALPYEPRLALTMAETTDAARQAYQDIRDALAAYEANKTKGNLNHLRAMVNNAVPNVQYAGKQLAKQAEDVVQKARADVEAMVVRHARQLGLNPADIEAPFAIEAGTTGVDADGE